MVYFQLALYTRRELNIRITPNFMLAAAAYNTACRPYLRKYFSATTMLPSDWIDVAEQYQVVKIYPHSTLNILFHFE